MSIRASLLNFVLRKYIKNIQPPVEERSYLDVREMMSSDEQSNHNKSIVTKHLQKIIFQNRISNIKIKEIYLENIRTLHFTWDDFDSTKCILYFHGGGYVAGSPETHQNMLALLAKKSRIQIFAIDYSLSPENHYQQLSKTL